MGARGPLPQLQVVRDHRGNPGHRSTPETAKAAPLPLPVCPSWLPATAKWQWKRMNEALEGLALAADGPALAMCLTHWALARKAAEECLAAEKLAVWDEAHERLAKHPAEAMFRFQSAEFLKYAQQLGMTVAARVRMPLRPEETDVGDGLFD
jgi:P27 family predicted phage terminase small subunit